MFRSYLRLLLFTFGLLAGIQVPGLVKDYSQRVEAHLFESREALDGFRQTAERFFKGDLQALLQHYRSSDDPVFNSDANSIESLMIRNELLENEWQALQGPWAQRTWHVLVQADPQLREEADTGKASQSDQHNPLPTHIPRIPLQHLPANPDHFIHQRHPGPPGHHQLQAGRGL